MTIVLIGITIFGVLSVTLGILLFRQRQLLTRRDTEIKQLQTTYAGIIDIDRQIAQGKQALDKIQQNIDQMRCDHLQEERELKDNYQKKRAIFEELSKELAILEENLEIISYGLYNPHYDYTTSDEYKQAYETVREKQKVLIQSSGSTRCALEWEVHGSKKEGARLTKQYSKLLLRAFNGECDAAVAKVRWNNIGNMEARIEKAYAAINKLGEVYKISITWGYCELKLEELRLAYELQEKLYQEKEEQRRIREQMRDEEKALREIEKAQKDAEEKEQKYQSALERARKEVDGAAGAELAKLRKKIDELEKNLELAKEQKERAMSRAQLTKSGHVYIISNIGSFGHDIYKIGMTRRLEPIDRVRELSDASVPFNFDIHALIYADNAPELETSLHKHFEDRRINLVNNRREFFRVKIDEIEAFANSVNLNCQLTKIAEAKEYRETQSLQDSQNRNHESVARPVDKFPASL